MMDGSETHLLAVDQGVCLQDETVDSMTYDDGTMLLLVVKGGVVFAYDLGIDAPGSHEQLAWTYPLPEGPKLMSMRCSLDRRVIAIQRFPNEIQLADLTSGVATILKSYKERLPILGYFFTEEPSADLVLVTKAGLELCQYGSKRPEGPLLHGIRVVERVKMSINWCVMLRYGCIDRGYCHADGFSTLDCEQSLTYITKSITVFLYAHETRCCMVGTGPPGGTDIQAWQFVSMGLVTLPPFVVGAGPAATALAPLAFGQVGALPMPLPPAPMVLPPGLLNAFGGAHHESYHGDSSLRGGGPLFGTSGEKKFMRLLKMYGRVYCAYINKAQSRVELYRFFTDTVVLQHSYEIFSKTVELSVIDNVLVIHHMDSAVALLFDVSAGTPEPISMPLPLGLLPPMLVAPSSPGPVPPALGQGEGGEISALSRTASTAIKCHILSSEETHDWSFCSPNIVISLTSQLRATAPKELLISVVKSALQERRTPMHVLREMFNNLSRAWADVCSAAAAAGRVFLWLEEEVFLWLHEEEVVDKVFLWLHEEEVVDVPFLSAALSEYCASAEAAGLPPLPYLQALATELLLLQAQPEQAGQATYLVLSDPATTATAANAVLGGADAGGKSKKERSGSTPTPSPASSTSNVVAMACWSEVAEQLGQYSGSAAASATAHMLHAKVAVLSAGCTAGSAAGKIGKTPAEHYIRSLLSCGSVLQAAQAARKLGVIGGPNTIASTNSPTALHPVEFLTAACKTGDGRIFAAVYRQFQNQLQNSFPKLEIAKRQLGFGEFSAVRA
eukprot:gene5340-12935_t